MKITLLSLKTFLIFSFAATILMSGCKKDEEPTPENDTFHFDAGASESDIQEAMITMANNDTIDFGPGTFTFTSSLSVEGKEGIVIRGDGKTTTTLDFSNQATGAQGISGSNLKWFLMQDFTVLDPAGDGIKIKDSDKITMLRVGVEYSTPGSPDNGGYGLYPVTSSNVLLDDCCVRGASDAGIYVGQSENIIVRNCLVEQNVAGIEIENCYNADVYDNVARNNTGGLLVFNLENLQVIPVGNTTRLYNNEIIGNQYPNFAPSGTTVALVPVGTGIMIMAYNDVEVFGNTISNNNIMSIGVVSLRTSRFLDGDTSTVFDPGFNPYNSGINIHDNSINRDYNYPPEADRNASAKFLADEFGIDSAPTLIPDLIYDGFIDPALANESNEGLCYKNNSLNGSGDAAFVNVDIEGEGANFSLDASAHNCMMAGLPAAVVDAPGI